MRGEREDVHGSEGNEEEGTKKGGERELERTCFRNGTQEDDEEQKDERNH